MKNQQNRLSLRWLTGVFVCATFLGFSSGASCARITDPCDEGCTVGDELYVCDINGTKYYSCEPGQAWADLWCSGVAPAGVAAPANCEGSLETGETTFGNSTWDPASHVTYVTATGVYEVDEELVDALLEDGFSPLILDSARLHKQATSGYYYIDDIASGDLADELGLEDGDVLKSINSYDLGSADDQFDAFQALKDETELELTVERSGSTVTIDYEIVR